MSTLSKLVGIVAEHLQSSRPLNDCSLIASNALNVACSQAPIERTVSTSTQRHASLSVAPSDRCAAHVPPPFLHRPTLSSQLLEYSRYARPPPEMVGAFRTKLARLYRTRCGSRGHRDRPFVDATSPGAINCASERVIRDDKQTLGDKTRKTLSSRKPPPTAWRRSIDDFAPWLCNSASSYVTEQSVSVADGATTRCRSLHRSRHPRTAARPLNATSLRRARPPPPAHPTTSTPDNAPPPPQRHHDTSP